MFDALQFRLMQRPRTLGDSLFSCHGNEPDLRAGRHDVLRVDVIFSRAYRFPYEKQNVIRINATNLSQTLCHWACRNHNLKGGRRSQGWTF